MTGPVSEADGSSGLALFDTTIGRCGVTWAGGRIRAVQLPEADDARTLARLRIRVPGAVPAEPPPEVATAIAAMVDLLAGQPVDLSGIDVDLDGVGPFERSVYEITRAIPPGATLTYGEVARRLGDPGAARAVGRALGANPAPIVIPCHRVLGAGGTLTGFSANGGTDTKRRMLLIEGAPAVAPSLFD